MKEIRMYTSIKQMKSLGFSQTRTAKELGIHRKTVKRYWNMTATEYEENCRAVKKISTLVGYRSTIEIWIKQHPSISAAQLCDWLKESYSTDFKERTVTIGTTSSFGSVDWKMVGSTAALATILSVLGSIASRPAGDGTSASLVNGDE